MEKEGFRRVLRWLRSNDIPIHSIATHRSSMYGSEIASFNDEFDESVEWFFDPWHLGRYLYKNLRAAAKARDCAPIKDWVEDIETHLYYSIADDITGTLTSCLHDPEIADEESEKPTLDVGSVAHTKLKQIVLQPAFQEALAQASP
ncbi:unnamed protein product [Cylicocyclus nassatus]|uniref:Transposase n=1 Tax=Cylicocyclus nassatus TaxID=53992 RepID=A0AA36DTT9_CYLNA|nr:unnamed protein product [Cylicocyclus nassatus]